MSDIFFMAVLVVIFVYFWSKKANRHKEFFEKIPGEAPLPVIGNALDFLSTEVLLSSLARNKEKHGDIFKVQIGPFHKLIFVSDYKCLETLLSSTKDLAKSVEYKFFDPWFGTGLLTSDGAKWKKHRRILTPAFHFQILEQFVEVFESCGDILVDKMRKKAGINSVEIHGYATLCALDIICETIMGIKVNAQMDETSDYVMSVKQMAKIILERILSPIQMFDTLFPLTPNYYKQKKCLKVLHRQTNDVIMRRKQEMLNKSAINGTNNKEFSRNKKPFLDILLEATVDGRPLTNDEIREEVDTFMFEGHDTTTSAISFTLFCLANNVDVQKKALEEQTYLFGEDMKPVVTYADLQNMKYLEQVIKENLRLYPSVPLYARAISDEFEYDGQIWPEGETVVVNTFGIHRNPQYFEDPEKFNPSRFDNIDGKLPYAYIPFSAGPRNCIGQKFAMLEIKSVISKVLRNFELKPAFPKHELKLSVETVLKSANGVKISLHER